MVTALQRKLFRDLRLQAGQLASIALLVGCSVMAFVGMRSTRESLRGATEEYYNHYRFADIFATLKRAPEGVAARIGAINGVGVVETRVVLPATLDVPQLTELASGLLVSVPSEPRAMLNNLHLYQGRYVAADRDDEAIVSVKFGAANNLVLGDVLETVVNGRWKRVRIVGIASSPEYIYEMGPGGFIVDSRLFGILWMRREALAAAGGMVGAFNDVSLQLSAGASKPAVLAEVDRILAPYGGVGAIGRERQTSGEIIDSEMQQLDTLAWAFPMFFLGIAAFLLNVVLSRLIATQRAHIGTLKSVGYSDRAVGLHYLGFAVVSLAAGTVLGMLGAMWLGSVFTRTYAEFFGIPTLVHHTDPRTAVLGVGVSVLSALAGGLWAVRRAVKMPPAEAMRPPMPARYHASFAERAGLGRTMRPGARMVMRNLTRRPLRTATSFLGIGMASAVLVAGMYPYDGVGRIMDVQFKQAQRDNMMVAFVAPRGRAGLQSLASIDGVDRVEGFRAAAVRFRHRQHVRTASLTGLDSSATLRQLVDASGGHYRMPHDGVVLTLSLAKVLNIGIGDKIDVELLDRGGISRSTTVSGVLDEPIGLGGYMTRSALNRLMGEGDVSSGAFMTVAPGSEAAVYERLKLFPFVAGTSSRMALLAYFDRTIAKGILISAAIVIFAAGVIAVGIIYNNSRIAISERGRELASLRVLGFTRGEVSSLFLGEQAIVTIGGLPIGAAAGLGMAAMMAMGFATERHRFPVVIDLSTYAYSMGLILLIAGGVALLVRRRLDRLDLIGTLKTGE